MVSKSTSLTGATLLLASLCSTPAMAKPGDHIRTGDTTVTPDVDVGFEYKTNVYRAPTDPVQGANMRIAPGLKIGVDSTKNAFEFSGEWELRKYLFLATESEVRGDLIRAIDRFNDFNVGVELDALKSESVGLRLANRTTLRNNETDRGVLGNPFVTQVRNALSAGVRVSPGDALDIIPGGQWAYDDFRVADSDPFRSSFNSRQAYGPTLDVDWDFFPRTRFTFHAEGLWNNWSENAVPIADPVSGVTGELSVPNSVQVKALTGMEGRFTERVFMDLLVGYGTALYEPSISGAIDQAAADLTGAEGIIGSIQIRYKVVREEKRSLEGTVGFKRDFEDAFFSNYVLYNQPFAQVSANVSGLRPRVRYSIRFEDYSGAVVRNDILNRVEAALGYDFQAWGKVEAGMIWQQRGIVQTAFQSAEYDDLTVHLKSTFTY